MDFFHPHRLQKATVPQPTLHSLETLSQLARSSRLLPLMIHASHTIMWRSKHEREEDLGCWQPQLHLEVITNEVLPLINALFPGPHTVQPEFVGNVLPEELLRPK